MNSNVPTDASELIGSVFTALRQGETLLAELGQERYARKLSAVFNACIGGHYRHCLDHFRGLLAAACDGDLDYDRRERGTVIEHDRFAALNATRELLHRFEQLDPRLLSRPLKVTCQTSFSTGGSQTASSTVGREMMYAVAHAVHHYALIRVMGALMDLKLPAGFGVAASTLRHQAESAQAT